MRIDDIKKHLRPQSILTGRRSTLRGAFAKAIAPIEPFDRDRVAEVMRSLEQNPDEDLLCVYCDGPAQTWDHLIAETWGSLLASEGDVANHGFGHQVGNLVPACGACNARKRSLPWDEFLTLELKDDEKRARKSALLAAYQDKYLVPSNVAQRDPGKWQEYKGILKKILDLMGEADILAKELRTLPGLPSGE